MQVFVVFPDVELGAEFGGGDGDAADGADDDLFDRSFLWISNHRRFFEGGLGVGRAAEKLNVVDESCISVVMVNLEEKEEELKARPQRKKVRQSWEDEGGRGLMPFSSLLHFFFLTSAAIFPRLPNAMRLTKNQSGGVMLRTLFGCRSSKNWVFFAAKL